jgi:hypothetical protein
VVVIKPRPLLTLYNPKLTIPGNADERRYFHLFSQTTAAELCGYFDSLFWARTVLQASLNEASIRHAVTAIAALSKTAEETPKNSQPMGISKIKDEHYRFGIQQYNKAITSLRETLATKETALRTALIACILFVCIEAIQGDQAAASEQVHSGLNLIQQVHRSRLQRDENGKQPNIEDEIVQMYANMDIQSFFLVFSQIPHHPPMLLPSHMQESQRHVFSSSTPRFFTSVSEAKRALDLILNSIVQFLSTCATSTEGKVEKYEQHHTRLRLWESAFQPLLIRAKAASDAKMAPVVLSTYHRVGLIALASSVSQEETVYDSLRKDFSYIVSSCRSVLSALTAPSDNTLCLGPPRPRFSFDVGILPPLYIVGSKCREPALRRQAIELLKICPVQEGLWEPFGVSRMCEWMMGIEELGMIKGGFVPESSRVRLSGMQCELSKRRIWVQCKGVVPETEEGLVKVWETVIRW